MKVWAIEVKCPLCRSPPGKRCVGEVQGIYAAYIREFHTARHEAAAAQEATNGNVRGR